MINKKIIILISILTSTICSAIDLGESSTLHGFGTLGGSYNTNENFIYRDTVFSTAGSSNDFSLATHSKFGLQLDTNISDQLKATIQGVTYQKDPGKLQTDLDWAYLKYSPTDYLNFKLGRMKIPFFIFSDSSNINYTNVWTHMPKETTLSAVPVTSYNGVEAEYLFNLGEHNLSLQSYFGEEKSKIVGSDYNTPLKADFTNAYGFSITDFYGDLKVRATYFTGDVKFQHDDLDALLANTSTLGITNAQNYDLSDLKLQLFTLGFNYQFDNIFLASEYTSVGLDNQVIDDMRGWYVSTGYQFNKIMPYVTYGSSKQKIGYPVTDIEQQITPYTPYIGNDTANYIINKFTTMAETFNYSQESISFGVRYDVYKNVALKTQVDRIFYDENHRTMYYRDGTTPPSGHLDVFSITLDFVF